MSDTAIDRRYGGAAPRGILPTNDVLDLLYRHRSVRRFTGDEVDDATVTAINSPGQDGRQRRRPRIRPIVRAATSTA